jgi:hypothetical protein
MLETPLVIEQMIFRFIGIVGVDGLAVQIHRERLG